MFRIISTRTHGMLDYGYAAALAVLPFLLRWEPEARRLAGRAAISTLIVSLTTRYECGLVRVLPMKAHLAADAAQSAALTRAGASVRDPSAAAILKGLGYFTMAVGMITATESPVERESTRLLA